MSLRTRTILQAAAVVSTWTAGDSEEPAAAPPISKLSLLKQVQLSDFVMNGVLFLFFLMFAPTGKNINQRLCAPMTSILACDTLLSFMGLLPNAAEQGVFGVSG